MNLRSPESRIALLGAGALVALSVSTVETQPVLGSDTTILDSAKLPPTLATSTPRPIPTLAGRSVVPIAPRPVQEPSGNKDGQPRPIPTIGPNNPVPVRQVEPQGVLPAENQIRSFEATPVPGSLGLETTDMQTVVFGPPNVPERTQISMVAEIFRAGFSIALPIVYGTSLLGAGFAAGYATKKYLRP